LRSTLGLVARPSAIHSGAACRSPCLGDSPLVASDPDAVPTGGGGALFKQRTVAADRPELGDAGPVLAATDRHPLSGRPGHDVGVEVDLEDVLGGMSRVRGVSTTT
jgi:hypothetical protein